MSATDLWRRKGRKRTALFWVFLLDFFTLEDWTDKLSRNVGKELPLLAA